MAHQQILKYAPAERANLFGRKGRVCPASMRFNCLTTPFPAVHNLSLKQTDLERSSDLVLRQKPTSQHSIALPAVCQSPRSFDSYYSVVISIEKRPIQLGFCLFSLTY